MNWSEIKEKAKEMGRKNMWNIWKPTLIIACISAVVGF